MRPSGLVTLLFTDIEGSTQRWERHPDDMGEAVRRHDELLRGAIESNGGYVFKTVGDAFCAAFARIDEGIAASLSLQRALQSQDFAAVEGIRVRSALHVGTCEERDADYFGPTVNRVARLLSIGHGGQMLLSGAAAELAKGLLPQDVSLSDLGLHQLKDLSQPERVAGLIAPGLANEFPPLHSLSTMSNNLPRFLTEIVGREREIGAVEELVAQSQLVTILGPGGIGKTRVAVQAAADLIDSMKDGAWFVDLAPLADPALVTGTVAKAVNLELRDAADPATALATLLKRSHMLIVLDNCEHVIAEAARLAELVVRACPEVRILATSREPFGIAGERIYRLDTLDVPSASALFLERARLADHRFELSGNDAGTVDEICRRLDGIPLAIELAAARTRVMPIKQLATRLDERFRLLTGGSRNALPRQQTLRALIDWSYDLISEFEKTVFRRLGAFSGGFGIDAAISIAADERTESWEVIDTLSALVDKSLVLLTSGETRYRMLESIREYALARLREAGEDERTHRAHAVFFADLSGEMVERFGVDSEAEWLQRYRPELDNFRAASDWATAADSTVAARLVGSLTDFWIHHDQVSEGWDRAEAALAALDGETSDPDRVKVLLAVGALAGRGGRFRRCLEISELALAGAERIGDLRGAATARLYVGLARNYLGEPERRVQRLREAAETHRGLGHPLRWLLASIDYATIFSEADPTLARRVLEEALPDARASGWPHAASRIEIMLAELEFQDGDVANAAARASSVVESCRTRKARFDLGLALINLCSYSSVANDYVGARVAGHEAMAVARSLDHRGLAAFALQGLAIPLADGGNAAVAAQLLGHVDALFVELGYHRERTEAIVQARLLELLDRRLDNATLQKELATGRTLTMDAACALALEASERAEP